MKMKKKNRKKGRMRKGRRMDNEVEIVKMKK